MLFDAEEIKTIVFNCYRKFKSFVYYSNNLQSVRLKIAEFEQQKQDMDKKFGEICDIIINESGEDWERLLSSVSYYVLPKITLKQTSNQASNKKAQFLSNCLDEISIDKVNFFVDVPIEVYIVDTLWTVLIGKLLVEKHIFGSEICANRLNSKVYNSREKRVVQSIDFKNISIYYPYFKGYKRWKNEAVRRLEDLYDSGIDSTLISLDLTSFYYSVNVDFDYIRGLLTSDGDSRYDDFSFLTECIKTLYRKYSDLIRKVRNDIFNDQIIIPIGLISSGTVSNLYLHEFDKKIKQNGKVAYYSRYVDDLLIIINSATQESTLKSIIEECFSDCLMPTDDSIEMIGYKGLKIQNSKIKVLKQFSNQSKKYINVLKQEITNTSETQLLPSVDVDLKTFLSRAYSYNDNSIKLREMDSLCINTLSVMRFIGSYIRSKKNTKDKVFEGEARRKKKNNNLPYYEEIDKETQEQLKLFFKGSTLFSLYLKWDKIFSFSIL